MKILVISGFLGAGKTTFIKEIIKKTKRDYCILENEYGAINIDSSTLKEEAINNKKKDDIKIYEFTEGCICCSSKGEFASSILTISNSLDPDYLIVEPTGVGYLSSILTNLKKVSYERIKILNAITLVDGIYFYSLLNNKNFTLDPCLEDQIKYASIIVVSKNESFNKIDKELINKKIKEINNKAIIINDEHYSSYDESFFKNLFYDEEDLESKKISSEIKTLPLINFSLKRSINLTSIYQLISILEDISRGFYGEILRSKGFIKIKERIYHFEMVNNLYTIEELFNFQNIVNESEAVFIGYNIDKTNLRNRFILINKDNNIS